MKNNELKEIKRIVSIVDTRQYEEGPDDRFHPIPGSGHERECDRCGRLHEVHATVETVDGAIYVLGVTCAKGTSVEKEVKNGVSRAKTAARLQAELKALQEKIEERDRIEKEVEALDEPPVVAYGIERTVGIYKGQMTQGFKMGKGWIGTNKPHKLNGELSTAEFNIHTDRSERNMLRSSWFRQEMTARGAAMNGFAIEERIRKIKRKLK